MGSCGISEHKANQHAPLIITIATVDDLRYTTYDLRYAIHATRGRLLAAALLSAVFFFFAMYSTSSEPFAISILFTAHTIDTWTPFLSGCVDVGDHRLQNHIRRLAVVNMPNAENL